MNIGVIALTSGLINSVWVFAIIVLGLADGLVGSIWYVNLAVGLLTLILLPLVWLGSVIAIAAYTVLAAFLSLEYTLSVLLGGLGVINGVSVVFSLVFLYSSTRYLIVERKKASEETTHPLDMPVYG